jgi:hypothetical protein
VQPAFRQQARLAVGLELVAGFQALRARTKTKPQGIVSMLLELNEQYCT